MSTLLRVLIFLKLLSFVSSTTQHCYQGTGPCFWLLSGEVSWDTARSNCQSQGGDMAVMETEELYDFVLLSFSAGDLFTAWVGLSDEHQESDWRWLNNAPLHYNRFHSTEPNGHNAANCIHFLTSTNGAVLDDIPCHVNRAKTLCSSIAPNCTEIKDGCTSFPAAFMGPITGPYAASNWPTAKSFCEDRGQKLLTIDSEEEQNYVDSVVNPTTEYWLGLTDEAVESVFRTTDGFVTPWAKWASGEPNDPNSAHVENCVVVNGAGLWNDNPCTTSWSFYCEGPRISINKAEISTETLIDNDAETCVELSGSDGCNYNQITIEAPKADQEVNVIFTVVNMECSDIKTVAWKTSWESASGKYKLCTMTSEEEISASKHKCAYMCDVTDAATMEIKIRVKVPAGDQPKLCEVNVN